MTPAYEWLFYNYAAPYLNQCPAFEDAWLMETLRALPLSKRARLSLYDAVILFRDQCCCEAFAHGVHLGMELVRPAVFAEILEDYRPAPHGRSGIRPADMIRL